MTMTFPGKGSASSTWVQHRDIRWEFRTADLLVGELLREDMGSVENVKQPSIRPTLQGIPLHFIRAEGKWHEQIPEGLDPSPRDRAWLAALAYDWSRGWDSHAYGTVPRSVGDGWSTHNPAVFFNEPASYVSGVMETTFRGVEDHAGRRCAKLEARFQFQGIADAVGYLTSYDLRGEILHALDDLMDIETRMRGTMEAWSPNESSGEVSAQKAEVDFRITRERLE
ncbi:hypothetical protein KBB96_17020 [Luteolibacter ambystomatis]|uniref:Uncharacterized protein n=1 Tax=Luteolibacter ambystomatis TaxID=2824561 RepID=A0A975G7V0_9BACT|nr:hypothetical protein [Luteolibacter ambystomatis]QUE50553.1 hypothetical protein KBB96_17020 [Luteolibacter ambystomatis]